MGKTWSKMICALDCRYHKLYLTDKALLTPGGVALKWGNFD